MMTFEEEIAKSGKLVYTTVGVSMRPLIKQGRDILIVSKPEGRLKKFDVPLYKRRNGQYVLHRVVKVKDDSYAILGDNCIKWESNIKDDQIIGVLTSLVRNGKEIDLNGFGYKFYSRAWYVLYPIRVIFMGARRLAGKIRRKLIRR